MSNSDTPRTDAEHSKFAGHSNGAVHSAFYFARQLERELAAMTADRAAQKAGWDNASFTALRLERELAAALAERDAARECLREAMECVVASVRRYARWRASAGLEGK